MASVVNPKNDSSTASPNTIDSPSYIDPNGYLFQHNDQLYRAIYQHVAPFYTKLIEDGTIEFLVNQKNLVPTKIVTADLQITSEPLVLHHSKIETVSYCVEWCPPMLQDAGLATLELLLELTNRGLSLQDAYPWNIVFDYTNPIFVDFTSIVPEHEDYIWPAFSQYQSFFYRALILCSLKKSKSARYFLYDNISGISLADYYSNLPLSHRFLHPGSSIEYFLDKLLRTHTNLKQSIVRKATNSKIEISRKIRQRFIKKEINKLTSLALDDNRDPWIDYYASIPDGVDKEAKTRVIKKIFGHIKPETVTDLGCNTGIFSIIAHECGAKVISVDSSETCISNLYSRAKQNNYKIHPIISDVLCSTPSFGLFGSQYPKLLDRIRSDTVLCLGLMHHLHIAGRQPFSNIAKLLASVTKKHLIFEYIAMEDENIDLITSNRDIKYDLNSVISALSEKFKLVESFESDRSSRRILLLKLID